LEAKIAEAEKAQQLLAKMNASEDIEDDKMGLGQRISAAIRKRTHAELEYESDDSEAESFDFEDVNLETFTDNDIEEDLESVEEVS
jgi:hypothetical protein